MYHPGKTYHFFDDTVLYAVWIISPVSEPIRISYDLNGAPEGIKPEDIWIQPGRWIAVSGVRPVWDDDHLFEGWSRDPKAKTAEYLPDHPVRFTEDSVLYAVWAKGRFVISYDLAGGTMNGQSGIICETYRAGTVIRIPGPPSRKGYQFRYWQGSVYHPGDRYTVREDHTLTAVWEKKTPVTGDRSDMVLWSVMILLGAAGIIISRRTNRSDK